jgi:hypothetical protein
MESYILIMILLPFSLFLAVNWVDSFTQAWFEDGPGSRECGGSNSCYSHARFFGNG